MDSQFNTLSRSYHDNYIQYSVTGVESYKTAYEAAQQGLDTILSTLKSEVDTNTQSLSGPNAAALFQDKQNSLNSIGEAIRKQKDRVTEAKMRQPPPPTPVSYQNHYTLLVCLLGSIVLIQFL
jgi:uncharacterized protein YukE